jgi:protein XagA
MRRAAVAICAVVLALAGRAEAGAWTLDRGHIQMISGVTASQATRSFDGASSASQRVLFRKMLSQNLVEYGLTDAVTLFAAPEFVTAVSDTNGLGVTRARDFSMEGGVRILLSSRIGMLSLQTSAKTAGAFDMSVSGGGNPSGRQFELRLLYGRGFTIFGRQGFFDFEVAERWIRRPRPNEMVIDGSAGLWVLPRTQFLFQTFNTISGGGAKTPYGFYRVHKFELSLVQRLTPRWSVQAGVIWSAAGQNIVKEQGFAAAVWYSL